MIARITAFVKSFWHDMFVLGCIVLIAIISYNLGRINALEKSPLKVGEGANIYNAATAPIQDSSGNITARTPVPQIPRDSRVVVSKSSTSKKYHYSWCSGVKTILPANQIWFENEATAQKAGYTLAGNCQ
ncbi:MAG: hypothetical protein AAB452_00660 [Patescibacteria group bacterium]